MTQATSPVIVGLVAFIAVVLAVISIYLVYEAVRQLGGQREVQTALKKLGGDQLSRQRGSPLLRELRRSGPDWIEQAMLKIPHRHDMAHFLSQAQMGMTVSAFTMLTIGLSAALGLTLLIVVGGWIAPMMAAMVGALVPYSFVSRKRRQRFDKFEEHFPEAIDLLGRAIRAGHAFSTGLSVVADESPEPISEEFRQVYEEQKFGLPLSESLLSLADRMSLLDVRIFVTAVLIQIESGGNLAEILDNLSHIIRDRFRFRRQLRTHTAHGRMTGLVLASAPFVAGGGMFVLNPDYMNTLFTEPLGRLMLASAAGLQLVGLVAIRRVMDVDL